MLNCEITEILKNNHLICPEVNPKSEKILLRDVFDSLSFVQAVVLFEECYNIEFNDEEMLMENDETMEDFIRMIQDKVAAKEGS